MSDIERLVSQIPGTQEMMSIPGVGLVTVAGFLAEVGDLCAYGNPRQIQKLAGLNLRENSSGKHKGQTKISRRGRPRLRSLLFRAVIPMLAKNAEFQELHSVCAEQKCPFADGVACPKVARYNVRNLAKGKGRLVCS